jgi:hypothetical protein
LLGIVGQPTDTCDPTYSNILLLESTYFPTLLDRSLSRAHVSNMDCGRKSASR